MTPLLYCCVAGCACRVLRNVLIHKTSAPVLARVSFTQCRKLRHEDLVDEVCSQENDVDVDRVIILRPMQNVSTVTLPCWCSAGTVLSICLSRARSLSLFLWLSFLAFFRSLHISLSLSSYPFLYISFSLVLVTLFLAFALSFSVTIYHYHTSVYVSLTLYQSLSLFFHSLPLSLYIYLSLIFLYFPGCQCASHSNVEYCGT